MTSAIAIEHDAALMLRAQAGDDFSFALLVTRYRAPLINYLFRLHSRVPLAPELPADRQIHKLVILYRH